MFKGGRNIGKGGPMLPPAPPKYSPVVCACVWSQKFGKTTNIGGSNELLVDYYTKIKNNEGFAKTLRL